MTRKAGLRIQRNGTVINETSSRQERDLVSAIDEVMERLRDRFPGVQLHREAQWMLKDVVQSLQLSFPDVDFHYYFPRSAMKPDGGILSMVDINGRRHCILIGEKKNQGTNDIRKAEGKRKQAKGNAIERLGKNVIGFRAALRAESIFPFVCFGDGCDFESTSSILDRVVTIAMFGQLNKEYLHNLAADTFNRGTFYFRPEEWTVSEMADKCFSIAEKSVFYYFSKHGQEAFLP